MLKYQVQAVESLGIRWLKNVVQPDNIFAGENSQDLDFSEKSFCVYFILEQIKNLLYSHFLPGRPMNGLTDFAI
jgi:hypothetical protein